MPDLAPDPDPGRLDPAVEGAIARAVARAVERAGLATRADVDSSIQDMLVTLGVLDAQLEEVRRPVLLGTAGRDPHVVAVPMNTDHRKRAEASPDPEAPAPSVQERMALMVRSWSPGQTARVAVFLVFVWWGTAQGGCNEVLSTARHLATEAREAYVGTAHAAAEALDTDVVGPVDVGRINGEVDVFLPAPAGPAPGPAPDPEAGP